MCTQTAVSVAGGDKQEQTTLNLLLNRWHYGPCTRAFRSSEPPVTGRFPCAGMSAKDSVVAPRWETRHHEDTFDPNPVRTATACAIRYWHKLTRVAGW